MKRQFRKLFPAVLLWMAMLAGAFGSVLGQNRLTAPTLDARSRGLGGISASTGESPVALLWNPANLALLRRPVFSMNMNRVFTYNQVGVSDFRPQIGALGIVAGRLVAGMIGDFAAFGWARPLGAGLAAGANLLFTKNAAGRWDGDFGIGAAWQPAANSYAMSSFPASLRLFVSFLHLGRSSKSGLVPLFLLGTSLDFWQGKLRWYSEGQVSRHSGRWLNGIEFQPLRQITLRLGIPELKIQDFAWGIGLNAGSFRLDIAYDSEQKRIQATQNILFGREPRQRAKQLYSEGIALLKRKEFLQAEKKFRSALNFDPDNTNYTQIYRKVRNFIQQRKIEEQRLQKKALAFENRGQFLAAYLKYRDLAEEYPENEVAKDKLSILLPLAQYELKLLLPKLRSYYERGELLTLRKILERVKGVSPEDTSLQRFAVRVNKKLKELGEEHYYIGLGYLSQKRFWQAERELKLAAQYDPALPRIREYLQDVHNQLVRVEAQIDSLKRVAKQAETQGNYAQAIRIYHRIVTIHPGDGESELALKRLEPIVEDQVQKLLKRARAALKRGSLEAAEQAVRRCLALKGGDEQALALSRKIKERKKMRAAELAARADALLQNGKVAQAVEELDRAVRYDPRNSVYRQKLKEARAKLDKKLRWQKAQDALAANEFDKAEKIVVDLLAAEPDNQQYAAFLKKLRTAKTRYVTFLLQNGIHLYSEEKYAEAVQTFNRLLAVDPANQTAMEYKKRTEEKIRALERLK